MKKALAFTVSLALGLGLASAVSAQAAKKQPDKPAGSTMMKPPPELGKINWMLGTWHCSGKAMASPMAPEHPVEAEVKVTLSLNGMWMLAHYREKKTAQNANPIAGDEYWGYDPAEKMWDRIVVDSTGSFATCTSKGWEGGKLVWMGEGMAGGQKMKNRETFTQKSAAELGYAGEMAGADGNFAPFVELSCKK